MYGNLSWGQTISMGGSAFFTGLHLLQMGILYPLAITYRLHETGRLGSHDLPLTVVYLAFGINSALGYWGGMLTNPGHVRPEWSKENLKHVRVHSKTELKQFKELYAHDKALVKRVASKKDAARPQYTYCFQCNLVKPYRAHHCSRCNRCCLKMDHHCFFINNCVGARNHKFFLIMTSCALVCSILLLFKSAPEVLHAVFRYQ